MTSDVLREKDVHFQQEEERGQCFTEVDEIDYGLNQRPCCRFEKASIRDQDWEEYDREQSKEHCGHYNMTKIPHPSA